MLHLLVYYTVTVVLIFPFCPVFRLLDFLGFQISRESSVLLTFEEVANMAKTGIQMVSRIKNKILTMTLSALLSIWLIKNIRPKKNWQFWAVRTEDFWLAPVWIKDQTFFRLALRHAGLWTPSDSNVTRKRNFGNELCILKAHWMK